MFDHWWVPPESWLAMDARTASAWGPVIQGWVAMRVGRAPAAKTIARPGGIEARSEASMMRSRVSWWVMLRLFFPVEIDLVRLS